MLNTLALTNAQNAAATGLYANTTHMAVGDSTTTPVVADTALGNETYRSSLFGESLSDNVVTKDFRIDEASNNGNTVNEIGTFDAASAGNMSNHKLTTSAAKTSQGILLQTKDHDGGE